MRIRVLQEAMRVTFEAADLHKIELLHVRLATIRSCVRTFSAAGCRTMSCGINTAPYLLSIHKGER